MDMTAPHFGFVAAAYAIALGGIIALTIYILLLDRAWRNASGKKDDDSNS